MRTKIIPFDLEMAKKIQAGEIEGQIVTKEGATVRIICFDAYKKYADNEIIALVKYDDCDEAIGRYKRNGELIGKTTCDDDLFIELLEEAPKHEFKPFDRVLVWDDDKKYWLPTIYSQQRDGYYETIDGRLWLECLPYEGNEHLLGTTNNPE